jgi:hypothetical protein
VTTLETRWSSAGEQNNRVSEVRPVETLHTAEVFTPSLTVLASVELSRLTSSDVRTWSREQLQKSGAVDRGSAQVGAVERRSMPLDGAPLCQIRPATSRTSTNTKMCWSATVVGRRWNPFNAVRVRWMLPAQASSAHISGSSQRLSRLSIAEMPTECSPVASRQALPGHGGCVLDKPS